MIVQVYKKKRPGAMCEFIFIHLWLKILAHFIHSAYTVECINSLVILSNHLLENRFFTDRVVLI